MKVTSINAQRVRSQAFGTRTTLARGWLQPVTYLKLLSLRVLRPERNARSLRTLHSAYWILVSSVRMNALTKLRTGDAARAHRAQMLFISEFSGDWEAYLEGFNRVLFSAIDLVWQDSMDWKRRMTLGDYLAFIRRYQLRFDAYYQKYGERAGVPEVRSALHVADRLHQFVFMTDSIADPQLFAKQYRVLVDDLANQLAA